MDIQMENRTAGITASRQILSELPDTKVIILTILEDDELLFQAYCAGVIDYIIKTDASDQILTSIRNAYRNQLVLRPQYAEKIIDELKRVKEEQIGLLYSAEHPHHDMYPLYWTPVRRVFLCDTVMSIRENV